MLSSKLAHLNHCFGTVQETGMYTQQLDLMHWIVLVEVLIRKSLHGVILRKLNDRCSHRPITCKVIGGPFKSWSLAECKLYCSLNLGARGLGKEV